MRFEWDSYNRKKIAAHRVTTEEFEQAYGVRLVEEQKLVGRERRKLAASPDRVRAAAGIGLHDAAWQGPGHYGIRIEKGEKSVATKTVKKTTRTIPVKVPRFKSESEEADWWYQNRALVEDLLTKHGRRVGNGFEVDIELKPATKMISIRLAEPDIERAKELAARKGIGYQTYLRLVLHEALDRQV